MGETMLVASITGFFGSFVAIGVLPKFLLRSRTTGGKLLRLLLSFVIAFSAFFVFYYYGVNFPLLEATIKSAVVVIIMITGSFVCIYLDRDGIQK